MRSSQAAVDLIVAEEVTSKEVYEAKYQHPEWPQGASGVTVGIGYDLGYSSKDKIAADWSSQLGPSTVAAMQSVSGITGTNARNALPQVKNKIVVPWNAAMAVFENNDMPRWEELVLKACPGSDALPPDCFGAIVSIAYNRGASFSKAGDRYTEMRNIRELIQSGQWDKIPAQIRSMKRLWAGVKNMEGLVGRREREAVLFEDGLAAAVEDDTPLRMDSGDDKQFMDVTPTGNAPVPPPAVAPVHKPAVYSAEMELLQTKLVSRGYAEIGDTDGKWGGKTRGAVVMFMNDRKKPVDGLTDENGFTSDAAKSAIFAEVSAAVDEDWHRPVAEKRKNATAADIAPKVASVNLTWYQKLWAYVLGFPAFTIAGFKSLFGDQTDPTGYVTAIKNFFSNIPTEYYALAAGGLAVAILISATKAQNATVKAYQKGEIN